ncbi:PEPxxWA-CTERM sorting domain-containing protein [Sandarakinorhabdus sp.]|uniref:PEPxxWA-CTERM sorting domain-containing protein n=1 Tax=Sandarakinorhabdus sp. TaxID=1916663 RepID=UPI00286DD555|nr:PEPxxWA-CTERM sorting domain-containing protein [Sandarakinorhabdus sp.]
MKTLASLTVIAAALMTAAPAQAVVGYADSVLAYFNSGAGPFPGPYGGTFPGSFPVPVSTSVVLGPDGAVSDFLSLPTGSFVTVGFTDETVIDGIGNDIFIGEVGAAGERANVFVSSDFINFVFLGVALDSASTAFDLASIGFASPVRAIKIVGLDNFGGSPGFDVAFIQVLPGSIGAAVPEPASWAMLIAGFGLVGASMRRRKAVTA